MVEGGGEEISLVNNPFQKYAGIIDICLGLRCTSLHMQKQSLGPRFEIGTHVM